MRKFQSSFAPWGEPLTSDGFIKEIKPADLLASVNIMNTGNVTLYLWQVVKIEPGASLQIVADQTAFLSLSKVVVHFDITGVSPGTTPQPILVVLAEKVKEIEEFIAFKQ